MDFEKLADEIGIGEDEYIDLVKLFLKTSAEDLKKLEDAIKGEDLEQAAKVAHHIKGASLNLELQNISAAAERYRKKCKTEQPCRSS